MNYVTQRGVSHHRPPVLFPPHGFELERPSLRLVLRRVRQQPLVIEDVTQITAGTG